MSGILHDKFPEGVYSFDFLPCCSALGWRSLPSLLNDPERQT